MAEHKSARSLSPRAAAALCLFQVVEQGQSLSQVLPKQQQRINPRDHGLTQELCFGVLRWLPRFEAIIQQLMEKPLKGKNRAGHFLIMVGLHQLMNMRVPAHAAVSETVNAAAQIKLQGFKKVINGVLRTAERELQHLQAEQADSVSMQYCHPSWFVKKLQAAYPEKWQQILEANNQHPPMWLRVNASHHSPEQYQALLQAQEIESSQAAGFPHALKLAHPSPVSRLPSFERGVSSVQDAAAQLAASLLEAQAGERVLDACAAPGGKTCHILELQPKLAELHALDSDAKRLERVKQNLQRIGLSAELHCGDAREVAQWNKQPFDRILLDAPCSATGVIRRHPDIKWLRRASDIQELVKLQAEILDAMWQQLKPGGTLLYATCSVLPEENREQIKAFLARHSDAHEQKLGPQQDDFGWQLLPGENNADGFFYAKLVKQSD